MVDAAMSVGSDPAGAGRPACALRHGTVPDPADLQVSADLPLRLCLPRPGGWHAEQPAVQADLLYRTVVEEHLVPLTAGLDVKTDVRRLLPRARAPALIPGQAAAQRCRDAAASWPPSTRGASTSEGPYQVRWRPLTSAASIPGKHSGPSPAVKR